MQQIETAVFCTILIIINRAFEWAYLIFITSADMT